jgi:glutathione synthase/RimK-type ligase-like ATP-grasp enzyme
LTEAPATPFGRQTADFGQRGEIDMRTAPSVAEPTSSLSARLNRKCFCITLDQATLRAALDREAADPDFFQSVMTSRPHLFSNVPVFLPAAAVDEMQKIAVAIEATTTLKGYRETVLSWAPEIAQQDFGPVGALMGYDFHLADDGAKLIEVNTNAGGAFLNALLAKAQTACCAEVERGLIETRDGDFETSVVAMFSSEWRRQRGAGAPHRIAIVDDQPEEQYLYPEFVLARQLLRKYGVDAVIGDASKLHYEGGRLRLAGQQIDLVYNRLVDFALDRPEHAMLRTAYREGAVVVTPNPHNHALLAAKRNLTLLSDPVALDGFGLSAEMRARLAGVPRTVLITPENADTLWKLRNGMFFKPISGHGSKAVYRGDKVTRGVWTEIARGGFVAQAFVPPGQRMIEIDGEPTARKMDVRLYTYEGRVLLAAARLYQGQTTNFRTPGGGFAPVLVM